MLRTMALRMARQGWIRKLVMSTPGLRDLAWRFVAGEDLPAALTAVRTLNGHGIRGTLNYLGMHIGGEAEANAAADQAVAALQAIHDQGIDSHVSVKLTAIGLDIDRSLCHANLVRILDRARELGNFVRIDMEESEYVATTIELFDEMHATYGDETVGLVIQSYLRDRAGDLRGLVDRGARIRLVKGGYREAPAITYRDQASIDARFLSDIELLMRQGRQPAIATHDPKAIDRVRALASEIGLAKSAFEFQMLYGVRADLQRSLARDGYSVRCYVPYGGKWWAWVLGAVRHIPHDLAVRLTSRFRR